MPSQRKAGTVHQTTRDGSCEAGVNGDRCWHVALTTAIKVGSGNMERFDDPVEPEAAPLLTPEALAQKMITYRAVLLATSTNTEVLHGTRLCA